MFLVNYNNPEIMPVMFIVCVYCTPRDFAAGICNKISEMIQGMCYRHLSGLDGLY